LDSRNQYLSTLRDAPLQDGAGEVNELVTVVCVTLVGLCCAAARDRYENNAASSKAAHFVMRTIR
jgi:hypothetical protein